MGVDVFPDLGSSASSLRHARENHQLTTIWAHGTGTGECEQLSPTIGHLQPNDLAVMKDGCQRMKSGLVLLCA